MSDLIISSELSLRLKRGEVSRVSGEDLEGLHSIAELTKDFLITVEDSDFRLERKESNLYDSPNSVLFVSLYSDGALSADYIGQDEATLGDFNSESIETAYDLLTVVNEHLQAPEGCIRVFIVHNYGSFFKDDILLDQFLDYVRKNDIYVAV